MAGTKMKENAGKCKENERKCKENIRELKKTEKLQEHKGN